MAAPANLLVVDDDTAMRQMLEGLFRREGYEVSEASSAPAALELAREREYDVVLSDVRMPGGSGIDLMRELRRVQPRARVVLMTAFGNVESAVEAMRDGACGYTVKPFEPEEVLRAVGQALEAPQRFANGGTNGSLNGNGRGNGHDAEAAHAHPAHADAAPAAARPAPPALAAELGLAEAARRGITLHELENLYMREVLALTGGRKGEAARRLGIDRKTLYRRDPTRG